ncbi:hypothetical protein WA026_007619 [Henosepilachna vigintioctopunctata]|uniref:Mesoderm induction early response protein 1 n=1 Tax=Henosepilachna vigintioctopunctata TaxID=420089 RepID=A0AAW1U3K9_9CUCU
MNSNMASTEQEDNNVENNNQEICDSEHEDPAKTLTSDNEEIVYSAEISVGDEYQADIPELVTEGNVNLLEDRAQLIYFPPDEIDEQKFDNYMEYATKTYGYNKEQSLAMLCCHNHNIERATRNLGRLIPRAGFSMKKEIDFQNAFQQCGKNFDRISELIDIKREDCVQFYYLWKRTKSGRLCVKQQKKPKKHFRFKPAKFKRCTGTGKNKTPSPDCRAISD